MADGGQITWSILIAWVVLTVLANAIISYLTTLYADDIKAKAGKAHL
jgi:hypothetical protein